MDQILAIAYYLSLHIYKALWRVRQNSNSISDKKKQILIDNVRQNLSSSQTSLNQEYLLEVKHYIEWSV